MSLAQADPNLVERLQTLGFSAIVAEKLSQSRPTWIDGVIDEQRRGIPPEASIHRAVTLYRGVPFPIENYDGARADERHYSSLQETAVFYAGLAATKDRAPRNFYLNTGVVLELQVPQSMLPTAFDKIATRIAAKEMPDESVYIQRVGLGHFDESALEGTHARLDKIQGKIPPALSWFSAEERIVSGRVRTTLPTGIFCSDALTHTLPPAVTGLW